MRAAPLIRCLAAVFAAAALAAGGAGSASAVTYSVWSCTMDSSPYARLAAESWFSPGSGAAQNFCPEGLELDRGDNLHGLNYAMEWQWKYLPSGSTFKKVTFTVKGGDTSDGLVYELASDWGGTAFAQLPPRLPGAPKQTLSFDMPEGSPTFVLRARCTQEVCSGADSLYVNDFRFRLDDSAPPSIGLATNHFPLNTDPDGATTGSVRWFRPTVIPLNVLVNDDGSGVRSAKLTIDGEFDAAWTANQRCEAIWEYWDATPPAQVSDEAVICDQFATGPTALDLSGRGDGRHKLTVDATDALGSSVSLTGWIGVDDLPPDEPEYVSVTSPGLNEKRWTQSPVFYVSVAQPPDPGPNVAPLTAVDARMTRVGVPASGKIVDPYGELQAFPAEGLYDVQGWYTDQADNRGFSKHATIGFDTTAPPAPTLDANDWVSGKDLRDYKQSWSHIVPPGDVESGICGFIAKFDREPSRVLDGPANVIGNVDETTVPGDLGSGTNFAHVASVSCADMVSATSTVPLRVDDVKPEVRIRGIDGSPWSRQEKTIELDPVDGLSGIASLHWKLDNNPPETAAGQTSLSLGDGEHTLRTWADDNAGNESDDSTVVIRVDTSGPVSWLGAPDPTEPSRFVAHVQDAVSGTESAVMQFRRIDEGAGDTERQWRQIGAAHLPRSDATGEQTFSRTLDDSLLADGRYELRVVAVDRAGSTAAGSTIPIGGQVIVDVPLRVRPTLSVAVADMVRRCVSESKGCASKTKCKRKGRCAFRWVATDRGAGIDRIVDWGDREALTGRLMTPAGVPIPGAPVTVYSTPRGGTRERAADLTTDADGAFEWRIPAGPSRSFEISSASSSSYAAATTTATEAIRAGLVLRASDNTVHSGQNVRFTGRLLSGGLGVPAGGKKIQLQWWHNGKWANGLADGNTDGAGQFKLDWEVPNFTSRGTLFVRAMADSQATETNWPFEAGKSTPVRVKARP